jgi:hypothetical protein
VIVGWLLFLGSIVVVVPLTLIFPIDWGGRGIHMMCGLLVGVRTRSGRYNSRTHGCIVKT